jgi:hypothetical protein
MLAGCTLAAVTLYYGQPVTSSVHPEVSSLTAVSGRWNATNTWQSRAVWKDTRLWEGLLSIRSGAKWVLLLSGTALLLAACAAGPNELVDTGPDPAGFWLGLWQGLISPITFIVSLFTTNVTIYEVQNNGNWYDFGFILGVACAFGSGGWGGTAGVRRTQKRASD